MYHIVYALFYLLSLLPWRVLYLVSDAMYGLVYHIIGYRKRVVMQNLATAFPDRSETERRRIAKEFYRGMTDSFIEMIKLLTISDAALRKRMKGNFELVNEVLVRGKNVQLHTGHFFSWEFMNLACGQRFTEPFLGVYMPLSNKIFDRLIYRIRARFGSVLVPVPQFRHMFHALSQKPYVIGLIADQSAGDPSKAYWYPFFGKLTPFVKGPEKGARRNDTAVIMVDFHRVRRGYYEARFELLTTEPRSWPEGEITCALIRFIEDCIRRRPANYLWSHRRWKRQFVEAEHGHLVIGRNGTAQ